MSTLILAGGGHGHINILKELIKKPLNNVKIILISDKTKQYYSGMLPGYFERLYSEEEISFNVKELCLKANVEFIEEKITKINADKKIIVTSKGIYCYDFLSLNLGGISKCIGTELDRSKVTKTKPIGELIKFIKKNDFENIKEKKNLAIIGGGASSVETAIALKKSYPKLDISIYSKKFELISNFNNKSKKKITEILDVLDIKYVLNHEFLDFKNNMATFKISNSFNKTIDIKTDFVIISSGIKGTDIDFVGLKKTEENFIVSDKFLRANEVTLCMGDMIEFEDRKLPKAGVFAIDEAPILFKNLVKMLNEENKFLEYKPKLKYLQILNTGNKTALLNYGNFTYYGKIPFYIKDYIDKKYMKIK